MAKYFLKVSWQKEGTEVTKEQFIQAAMNVGFLHDKEDETATGSFCARGIKGWTEE